MHRTFRGAKRSTGARLEQKLVQLTGQPRTRPSGFSRLRFLPFANAGDFPSRTRARIFRLPRKEANPSRRREENQRLDADDRRVSATYRAF